MTVGGVRTSDISDLDRIYPMGHSNLLKFCWVRYIQRGSNISAQGGVQRFWNPMKGRKIRWVIYIQLGVGYV
jgi:hypothetical protein